MIACGGEWKNATSKNFGFVSTLKEEEEEEEEEEERENLKILECRK